MQIFFLGKQKKFSYTKQNAITTYFSKIRIKISILHSEVSINKLKNHYIDKKYFRCIKTKV